MNKKDLSSYSSDELRLELANRKAAENEKINEENERQRQLVLDNVDVLLLFCPQNEKLKEIKKDKYNSGYIVTTICLQDFEYLETDPKKLIK